jgi:hypothetical protein
LHGAARQRAINPPYCGPIIVRQFLRHTLATLAYRGGKVLRDAPADFSNVRACSTCRSALEILAHLADLMWWAVRMASGENRWESGPPQTWAVEEKRFFDGLQKLDEYLASEKPLGCSAEKIFQGPIADALTHVGQLATLRRLAGSPIRGENYFVANIQIGHVGPEQAEAIREFD